jgi:hypothetical protein
MLHMYGGCFHRVPDWKLPRCGVHNLWRHWWLGDTVRQIPPLKYLKIEDTRHIDGIPLTVLEKVRKVGPNPGTRLITKVLTDMRFLCKHITNIVQDMGKLEEIITISAVDQMFAAAALSLLGRERDRQKQWISVVRELRKKMKNKSNNNKENKIEHEFDDKNMVGTQNILQDNPGYGNDKTIQN